MCFAIASDEGEVAERGGAPRPRILLFAVCSIAPAKSLPMTRRRAAARSRASARSAVPLQNRERSRAGQFEARYGALSPPRVDPALSRWFSRSDRTAIASTSRILRHSFAGALASGITEMAVMTK